MAGRATIVGAAATHVGKVREHNEDAHFFDADAGMFLVCDGMGGHAAGEVASALAIRTIRAQWSADGFQKVADTWLSTASPDARKQLLAAVRDGVTTAHDVIIAEAARDEAKTGMGTTLVGAMIIGNELVFAHAGDSRAYLVRDAIAMQLTEDHTLLARLLAAGIDVDVSGEGSRFRSMLTNALGIGQECKVSTFIVPLADGDRFLLCSDGISEYVKEFEVGEVLSRQPSPARAAQKLIELALDRGGGDNATAVVVRVLEAGETPQPSDSRTREDDVIKSCPLWIAKVTPQQRLRALRIASAREYAKGDKLPAHTLGDRVAWILVEGELQLEREVLGPGAFVYPESLLADSPAPDKHGLAVARTDIRALAFRADDFRELCEDDTELGEALLEGLGPLIAKRRLSRPITVPSAPRTEPDLSDDRDRDEGEVTDPERGPGDSMELAPPGSAAAAAAQAGRSRRNNDDSEPEIHVEREVELGPAGPPGQPGTSPPRGVSIAAATMTPAPAPARPSTPVMPASRLPSNPPVMPARSPSHPPVRPSTPTAGVAAGAAPSPAGPPSGSGAGLPKLPPLPRASGQLPSLPRTPNLAPVGAPLGAPAPRQPTPPPVAPPIAQPVAPPKRAPTPRPIAPRHVPVPTIDEERGASTEPEIEAYLELEADVPPGPPGIRLELDPDEGEPEQIETTVEDGLARVINTVTDSSTATVTVTREESVDDEPTNIRPITSESHVVVSGTISVPDGPRRRKRVSEGWEE